MNYWILLLFFFATVAILASFLLRSAAFNFFSFYSIIKKFIFIDQIQLRLLIYLLERIVEFKVDERFLLLVVDSIGILFKIKLL